MSPSPSAPPGSPHEPPRRDSPASHSAAHTVEATVQPQQEKSTPSTGGPATAAAGRRNVGRSAFDKAADAGGEGTAASSASSSSSFPAAETAARSVRAATEGDAEPGWVGRTRVAAAASEGRAAGATSGRGGEAAPGSVAAAAATGGGEGGDGGDATEVPRLLQERLSQCVDAACRDRERKSGKKTAGEDARNFAGREYENEEEEPPDRMAIGHAAWGVLHSAAATWKQQPGYLEQQRMHEWIHAFAALFPCVQCRTHFQPFLQREPPWTREGRAGLSLWACKAHNYVNENLQRPLFNCDVTGLLKRWTRTQWPEPGDEEE